YLSVHDTLPCLPTFPTRRSSDLRCGVGVGRGVEVAVVGGTTVEVGTTAGSLVGVSPAAANGVAVTAFAATLTGAVAPAWLPQPADRKSTRLNSSHVKISYAVFCL